jgi:8-oxo-dGTP diphosphatase
MTTLDDLWYLADEADQRAEQVYHRLDERHDDYLEVTHHEHVSRRRFRTLAERIRDAGAPYGAHTVVYRPSGDLVLVYHDAIDTWVLPGGGVDGEESLREAAERELGEEADVDADYEGLGILTRVEVRSGEYSTWGVMPVFQARADPDADPEATDPDGEITEARWFAELPEGTRDREDLVAWRERYL